MARWIVEVRSALVVVFLAFSPVALGGVVVGDREWRQPLDTVGLAYDSVATVCSTTTGACNGALGAIDFTAWTWASVDDTAALLREITMTPLLGDPPSEQGVGTEWAPRVFTLFHPTFANSSVSLLEGLTRDTRFEATVGLEFALASEVADSLSATAVDYAQAGASGWERDVGSRPGIWLYRPAAAVPAPAVVTLLVIGVFALFGRRMPSQCASTLSRASQP